MKNTELQLRLIAAKIECERFIEKANEALEIGCEYQSRENGAAKRAAYDASSALAKVNKQKNYE